MQSHNVALRRINVLLRAFKHIKHGETTVTLRLCSTETKVTIGEISKELKVPKRPEYVPTKYLSLHDLSQTTIYHLRWMLQKDLLGQDMFLLGAPGPGRRLLALQYLELTKRELEYIALSRDTTESDLKQRREIISGTAKYFDQSAVRAAIEGRVLVLEGIEKAERNVLPVLNNLLENREMHLEDGRLLIPAERYDKLLEEHGKEELEKWKLVRVNEDFRVIALGLPVPKFTGNLLDPPLRSRFQARDVSHSSYQMSSRHPKSRRSSCASQNSSPRVKIQGEPEGQDLETCLVKLQLVISSKLTKTDNVSKQSLPLSNTREISATPTSCDDEDVICNLKHQLTEFVSTIDKTDEVSELSVVEKNEGSRRSIVCESPESVNIFQSEFVPNGVLKKGEENNTLSDRVLQWLDLAGSALVDDSIDTSSVSGGTKTFRKLENNNNKSVPSKKRVCTALTANARLKCIQEGKQTENITSVKNSCSKYNNRDCFVNTDVHLSLAYKQENDALTNDGLPYKDATEVGDGMNKNEMQLNFPGQRTAATVRRNSLQLRLVNDNSILNTKPLVPQTGRQVFTVSRNPFTKTARQAPIHFHRRLSETGADADVNDELLRTGKISSQDTVKKREAMSTPASKRQLHIFMPSLPKRSNDSCRSSCISSLISKTSGSSI